MRTCLWAISTVCKRIASTTTVNNVRSQWSTIWFARIANKAVNGFVRETLQNYPAWLSRTCDFKVVGTVPSIFKNREVSRLWRPKPHFRCISVSSSKCTTRNLCSSATLFQFVPEIPSTDLFNISQSCLSLPQNGSWWRSWNFLEKPKSNCRTKEHS